jgi:hypothetical protein
LSGLRELPALACDQSYDIEQFREWDAIMDIGSSHSEGEQDTTATGDQMALDAEGRGGDFRRPPEGMAVAADLEAGRVCHKGQKLRLIA